MQLYRQEIKDRNVGSWRYGLGVIASRENKLLKTEDVDRLFAAESKAEFDRLRAEFGYGGDNLSQVLEAAKAEDIDLLASLMPDSRFLQILLLTNDLHNLKATVKASLLADRPLESEDLERLYTAPYTFELGDFLSQLKGEANDLSEDYRSLINSAGQVWHQSYDPAEIDAMVDRFYWQQMDLALRELNNNFLTEYYRAKRDLINLEVLLRAYRLESGVADLEKSLVPVGCLAIQDIINWFIAGKDSLINSIKFTPYSSFTDVIRNYGQPGSASAYQAAVDNHLAHYIRENVPNGAGPERILAYFFAREQERKNIELARITLVNKLDQTRIAEIKREVMS